MPYDEELAVRVRALLATERGVSERKMFGGLAFMVGGHMCCGVLGSELVVRVGPDAHEQALMRAHARPMDFTGRPMRGMVFVGEAGVRTAAGLRRWIGQGLAYVRSLPAKPPARRAAHGRRRR